MGWINNQEVLGKLRQVLNEILEQKAQETARSLELNKRIDALEAKVDKLGEKVKLISLTAASMDERQTSHTKMMELLGKKVNEIGKTVDDHFESFVKVNETDSEFFKLIAQALTGKTMEEDEESTKDKGQGTKEAEKTVSGTDGNGKFDASTAKRVSFNHKAGFIRICNEQAGILRKWDLTYIWKVTKSSKLVEIHFCNEKRSKKVCNDGRIYCVSLVKALSEMEGDIVLSNLYANESAATMILTKWPKEKFNQKK